MKNIALNYFVKSEGGLINGGIYDIERDLSFDRATVLIFCCICGTAEAKDVDLSGCVLRMTVKDQGKTRSCFTAGRYETLDAVKKERPLSL